MSHAVLRLLERGTRPLRDRGGLAATPVRAIAEPLDREVFNRTARTVRPPQNARAEPVGTRR